MSISSLVPRYSRPLVAATLLLVIIFYSPPPVNAINSDQQQTTSKSETTPATTAAKTQQAQQVRKVTSVQSSGTLGKFQQGRIVRNRSTSTLTTTRPLVSLDNDATTMTSSGISNNNNNYDDSHTMMIHEEIRRVMDEYRNTPPLFVTPTRDFFLDIASYPLGYKLTTIQALDSEGDSIEYSLKRANHQHRDASPYFSINSTTGELRLANKQIPLESFEQQQNSQQQQQQDSDDEEQDEVTTNDEKPSYLYFLNVAANDSKYESVVELQIHVFNTSTWGAATGTRTPVQLTIEGGRQGGGAIESLVSAKTREFFNKLYPNQQQRTIESPTRRRQQEQDSNTLNSSLVFPTFVNPGLTLAVDQQQHNELVEQQHEQAPPSALASSMSSGEQRHAQLAIISHAHPLESTRPQVVTNNPIIQQQQQQAPPVMLSLVIIICACLAIVLVTLVFLIPLSVKRLKKRLKNMEQLQHEQLSSSSSASSACSTSGSSSGGSGASSTTTRHHHHHHLPGGAGNSLSQFTIASDLQRANCSMLAPINNHQVFHQRHQHLPLGRQSSLDSAITQANFTSDIDCSSSAYQAQLSMQTQINGLNRAKQHQQLVQHHQSYSMMPQETTTTTTTTAESNNIYCPIDDEFYSTIDHQVTTATATPAAAAAANCVIMGQTFDSRQYFGAQCAPQQMMIVASHQQPARDTDTPISTTSSRSSTRSLARFLSLPARHWSRTAQPEVARDRKQRSCLDELEQQLGGGGGGGATLQHRSTATHTNVERHVKTIARASHISSEHCPRSSPNEDTWELERHKLKFLDILDEGQFGLVWRCKLRHSSNKKKQEQTVAVKTLKSSAERDEREREELLAEIEIMKLVCGHPNVVRILHCCTRDLGPSKPILLVMEHVELGKLQWFLKKSRTSHNYATVAVAADVEGMRDYRQCEQEVDYDEDDDEDDAATTLSLSSSMQNNNNQLSSRELIKFIYHVAKGMEYISSQSLVHRDLASRNVLISSQRVCKIGDFGMARRVADSNNVYERHSRNTKIPVRWMAPEVLLENCFTTQSDVYSFGILMWEIVTLGSTPYRHLETKEIFEAVAQRGERPQKPNYCHALLYSIMSRCWSHDWRARPTFSQLVSQLDELLNSSDEYIQLDQYPDNNYYNIPQTAAPLELL